MASCEQVVRLPCRGLHVKAFDDAAKRIFLALPWMTSEINVAAQKRNSRLWKWRPYGPLSAWGQPTRLRLYPKQVHSGETSLHGRLSIVPLR